MLEAFKKYKGFIIGLILLALAFAGYQWFIGGEDEALLSSDQEEVSEAYAASERILALLVDLRSIQLDNALFSTPVFQSLQDFSTPLSSEPVGRSNPFAPSSGISQ